MEIRFGASSIAEEPRLAGTFIPNLDRLVSIFSMLKPWEIHVGSGLPRLFVFVLTGSANTTSLHLDEDVIVTQFRQRNLDDGEFGGL